MPTETDHREMETLFLALGDRTRLRLLALMADAPVSVGFLADSLNESQPKVSRHLAYLRKADLVFTERDGKWIYYGIKRPKSISLRGILNVVVESITPDSSERKKRHLSVDKNISKATRARVENISAETYVTEDDDLQSGADLEEEMSYESSADDPSYEEEDVSYEDAGCSDEMEIFLL